MVPITLAAVGPHALRLAGEVADGARLHGFCTRRYLVEFILPHLQQGMTRTGRARENFEITGGGFIATGPDEETTAKAFELIRGRLTDAVNMHTGEVNTDRAHAPSSADGGMPPDLLQDIRKIPTPFKDYKTAW